MANYTTDAVIDTVGGPGPFAFDLPVKSASKVFKGSLVSQLTASGFAVVYSTASTGVVVGVAQHLADNTAAGAADGDKRVRVETKRCFAFESAGFSEASLIGSLAYGTDDHTVSNSSNSQARKAVGFFMGMESDGKARVYVDPCLATLVDALQTLTDSPATADALRDNIVAKFG